MESSKVQNSKISFAVGQILLFRLDPTYFLKNCFSLESIIRKWYASWYYEELLPFY